jgi:hypothetical protein
MHWRYNRFKYLVLALLGIVFIFFTIALLTPSSTPASAVSVTFLHTTNHAQLGNVGVFQFVNHLKESVSCSGGHYKPALRAGLNGEVGDWGATILDSRQFPATTTNIIHLWIPTNGGPFRLVLQCVPASKATPAFYGSLRARFASFISPFVKPSFVTQAKWYGSIFPESQPFETAP